MVIFIKVFSARMRSKALVPCFTKMGGSIKAVGLMAYIMVKAF